jgi:hypothetical protein
MWPSVKMSKCKVFKKHADTHVGTISRKIPVAKPRILFTKIYILHIIT